MNNTSTFKNISPKLCLKKRALLLCLLLLCLGVLDSVAQEASKNAISKINDGTVIQNILNANDLSQINADKLSDADILSIQAQFQNSGLSIDQAEPVLLAKGLPQAQWTKLKSRLQSFVRKTEVANNEQAAAAQQSGTSNMPDYKTYQKSATSNVFGASFFNTASLSFEPNLRIATPVNYILGPDDELAINVSGYQEVNLNPTVQPDGTIAIPQVGPINVNGLTIEQATTRIKSRMGQTAYPSLRNNLSKLVVSLGRIRSIHITIIGAAKPGNYTVSSLATVFNSLYQCGGPGDINSYRNIELIRNNKVYQTIDLYQFLTRGDQRGNMPLKENDVINFPVYQKHVTINGQVKREGVFELKGAETLDNLLFFAGGFTDKAYRASIKVKQITDTERKIRDISKAEIATYVPSNGDIFQVDSVLDRYENGVAISGAVYRPGQFELTPGLTVSGLIKKAGGLQENVFTDRAIISRTHADGTIENITFNIAKVVNGGAADIPLVKRDSITIAAASEFRGRYTVQIQGEVKHPGRFPYKENFSLKDLMFTAGGFTDAASSYHVEIGRRIIADRLTKNVDSIATVFEVNTTKGLTIENDKFILQPYDIITVRRNPGYVEQQQVNIAGEVNYPGNYTIKSKQEHVSDLIKRAGGLTPQAYSGGVFLIRNDVDSAHAQRQSVEVVQRSLKDTSSKVLSDVNRNNVRIAVNLDKIMDDPGSIQDYVLQNGDQIQVLKQDPLVKVSGEVLSATKTGYVKNRSLEYYITQAGGTTDRARRSKIYVLYANGKISRTRSGMFGLLRSYPDVETGSEIIVPRKQDHRGLSTAETIGIASGLASLVSLIIVTISTLRR